MIETAANIFIPFLTLIILNTALVTVTKKSFGKCLPVTMMGIVYILYFSQFFFNTFKYGLFLIFLFPVVVLVPVLLRRIKPDKELIITDGLIVFVLIYVFFTVLNFNKWILICDEYTHWGMMVKEMLRLDRFYCVPGSRLGPHREYPPFMALFELFWVKICGNYSEMGTTTALDVFQVSIVAAPLLDRKCDLRGNAWLRSFFKVFAVLLIIVIFDPYCVLTTVYKDLSLPLIFAYSVSLLLDGSAFASAFGLAGFALSLGALISAKELGVAFVSLSVFLFLFLMIKKLIQKDLSAARAFISVVTALFIPGIMKLSWGKIVSGYLGDNAGQFSMSEISPQGVIDVVTGVDQGLRHEVFRSYLKALIKTPISDIVSVTFLTAFAVIIILLICLWRKYREKLDTVDVFGLGLMFVFGTAGFAFTMGVLYLFCFSEAEMQELASYSRYMSSYVLGEAVILFVLFLTLWSGERDIDSYKKQIAAILAIVFLITFAPATTTWIPQSLRRGPFKTINADIAETAYECAGLISEHTEADSRIYIFEKNDWVVEDYIEYLLNDRSFSWNEPVSDPEAVSSSDYIFTGTIDESLSQELSPLCTDGALKEKTVYRVLNDGNGISLEAMN
ncbi:MAG: hypothetical protein K6G42_05000 [Lachnospiraceae bacterium]|nr:hypothetical protein [Lachnospiraceae bacterium]